MKKILASVLGLLLIASNCHATLITYSTLSSDAAVTTANLNTRFSELKTVINGNIDGTNYADGSINSADIAVAANPLKRDGENIGEYVYTGLTIATVASLTQTTTAGTAYVANDADSYLHRVATAATSHTYTASKDTYVYLDYAGAFIYSEVANGASQPSTPSNSIIIAKVVTDGSAITSVSDLRQTTPVNLRIYLDLKNGCVVSRDITTATKAVIGRGEVELAGTSKLRRNTTNTVIDFTTTGAGGLDTGSLAAGYYYIFATADSSNSTNFKGIASTSSTDATGVTDERLIGWVYAATASALSGDSVGAWKGRGGDAPNICQKMGTSTITTTAASYVLIPDMELKFVSSGRPIRCSFNAPIYLSQPSAYEVYVTISIDGENYVSGDCGVAADGHDEYGTIPVALNWKGCVPAGEHTIQAKWLTEQGITATQRGSRTLIVEEL